MIRTVPPSSCESERGGDGDGAPSTSGFPSPLSPYRILAMHTKDKLAQALTEAGLHEMAAKAAEGYYHDFLSPLDLPEMQLDADLYAAGTPEALALRRRHHDGEFDASVEESDEWAKSADGQETFRRLLR